ncbi:MAG TPA: M23 family metallopeptidase [Bacteroidales bacterium]|nr:M23 family metallopeptidase [Bacteroidales bacterium]
MRKTRYHFNTRSLTFEKVTASIRDRFLSVLKVVVTGSVFAAVVIFLAYNFFESPREKMLERENKQLRLQYNIMNDRMERIAVVLDELQDRDDNIYRVIFESEPIPSSVRRAGMGGSDRYTELSGFESSKIMTESAVKLDELANRIVVQSRSFDEVFELARNKDKMLRSIPAIQPVNNKDLKKLSSFFGYRIHPIFKRRIFHDGLDFTAPVGTKVYATGDGVVVEAVRARYGYGNRITINHGYGYQTTYAHLNSFAVREGERVQRGQIIGSIGNTGLSSGPHLHYEVIKNGTKVNPIYYFFGDLSPQDYQEVISRANSFHSGRN